MPWIALDTALALLSLVVLVLAGLALWRRVKALTRAVGAAGERIGPATDRLARLQVAREIGAHNEPAATPMKRGPRRVP